MIPLLTLAEDEVMNTITSIFGLNDLLCGHNAWIMTGIQYDDLSTRDGEVTGTTHWLAYRTFFQSSPRHFRTKKNAGGLTVAHIF